MPFQSRYALEEKKFNEEKCSSAEMKILAFWENVHLVILSDGLVNGAGLLTPIDVTFCTVLLFYSLVIIDSPGELGSAWRGQAFDWIFQGPHDGSSPGASAALWQC